MYKSLALLPRRILSQQRTNNNIKLNSTKFLSTMASPSSSPFSIVEHKITSFNHASEKDIPRSFAVFKLSGTQYKVTIDDVVTTHKIKGAKVGEQLELSEVLLIGTKDETIIGRPLIPNAKVTATVEEQTRDKKLLVFKKKKRKGYKKKQGHRSYITVLRINDIVHEN